MPEPPGTIKFTANIDADTDARFRRLVGDLGEAIGRVQSHRGRRHPTRHDALRAMLAVVESDAGFRAAVVEQVRTDLTRQHTEQETT